MCDINYTSSSDSMKTMLGYILFKGIYRIIKERTHISSMMSDDDITATSTALTYPTQEKLKKIPNHVLSQTLDTISRLWWYPSLD